MEEKQLHTIVSQSISGDKQYRKMLYNLLAPMMLSVAHRYSNTKADAEDIFQESVLIVFDKLNQLREPERIAGWAKKVVVNEAIRFYNKKRNIFLADDVGSDSARESGSNNTYVQIETDELLKVIQQLPYKMRMVINLYAIEGYKHEEIAEMLQISVGTSKSNLHDARKRIQKMIQEDARKIG